MESPERNAFLETQWFISDGVEGPYPKKVQQSTEQLAWG
jgi:hypothetical protein